MNGRNIFEALSFVEDKFVAEAESGRYRHKIFARIAAMAACLCIVVGLGFLLPMSRDTTEGEITEMPEMAPELATEAAEAPEGGLDTAAGGTIPLLLTVDQRTENGFLGTVQNTIGDLEAGTQVEVCPAEGAQWDLPEDAVQVSVWEYIYFSEENVIFAGYLGKDE